MKIKKSTNETNDIDDDLITVTNFFTHFIKEISITRYGNNQQLIETTIERRTYNSTTLEDITDDNLDDGLDKFKDQLKNEYVYRIPLRYFTDIGKINFPLNIDLKIKCHLETEMKRLFESTKKGNCNWRTQRKNYFYKGSLYSIRTNFPR